MQLYILLKAQKDERDGRRGVEVSMSPDLPERGKKWHNSVSAQMDEDELETFRKEKKKKLKKSLELLESVDEEISDWLEKAKAAKSGFGSGTGGGAIASAAPKAAAGLKPKKPKPTIFGKNPATVGRRIVQHQTNPLVARMNPGKTSQRYSAPKATVRVPRR